MLEERREATRCRTRPRHDLTRRVAGSFTLDFDGEVVTGDFDIDVACVDSRPPA